MSRIFLTFRNVAATTIVVCCLTTISISAVAQADKTNTFQWDARPQLTADQQKLLGLERGSQMGDEDSPL